MSRSRILLVIVLALVALLLAVEASPMYYKKVGGQKYEPDWVAVSSTVIPLAEYRVSVGAAAGPKSSVVPDEYRRAYQRHKKLTLAASKTKAGAEVAAQVQEDPDTLITANKKYYEKKAAGR